MVQPETIRPSKADTIPLLEVRSVSKSFPGVHALQSVDLELGAGEVLAVIGENGAGKSTLMKILAGVQLPDSGEVRIDGQAVRIDSVQTALELNIALIHQELNLADNLDVAANIFLGREPTRFGLIDRARTHREAADHLQSIGLNVDPNTLVSKLTIGHQQMVEIAKALSVDARVLIMDEPTSSLSAGETEALFKVVNDLKQRGVSIVYISHRLGEVMALADRVAVLRDGQNAGELTRDEITHDAMVQLMVGRDVSQFYARQQHELGETLLSVRDVSTTKWPSHRVSFEVKAGEIVGVAGLVGAGRTELLHAIFGIDPRICGSVEVDGKTIPPMSPRAAIESGLALVPEDRKKHGLLVEMSVRNNTGLAGLKRFALPGGFYNSTKELEDTEEMVDKLNVKTPSSDQVAQFLSGGNQQKVVLGKWLALTPKVLLLDEPTRGIDIGAKEEIYQLMEKFAADGMAILFVSSEMEEIIGMSDRAIVMHEGRLSGQLQRDELNEEAIMQLATGNTLEPAAH